MELFGALMSNIEHFRKDEETEAPSRQKHVGWRLLLLL